MRDLTIQTGIPPLEVRLDRVVKVQVGIPPIEIQSVLVGVHNHDTRYYRKDEIDQKFEDFAPDLTPIEEQINGHVGDTNNPHGVNKAQVGLGNVDNTSDLLKPISTAVQSALNDLSSSITAIIGGAPIDANTLKKLNDKILGIQTLLNSDNVNLDNVQELVDAIETIQISLSTILVNDLTTGGTTKALTAQQGVVLKGLIDALTTVVASKAVVAGNEGNIQYKKGAVLAGEDNFFYDEVLKSTNLYLSLGAEKVSTATLGSGFTQDATNYKKSANGTAPLTITTNSLFGEYYLLCINVTGLTVGSATVVCAGRTVGTITANGLYKWRVRALSSGGIVITPTNTARFDITKSLLSLKKFTGGEENIAGRGNFGDKLSVTKTGSNYYPGDDEIFEFNNPQGSYSNQVFRFGSVIKAAIQAVSQGYLSIMTTDSNGVILQNGYSIGGQSPYCYLAPSGIRQTQGFGQFAGKLSAGNAYSNLPSKLDVWGSKMEKAKRIFTQNFVLDDECLYVYDTTNAVGCTGSPATNCNSYGANQSVCESHAELGCSFVIQYYCSDFSYGNYGELNTCANAGGCNVVTSACGSASSSEECTNRNQYGGNCAYNYYEQSCGGFNEADCNNNSANGCTTNTSPCSASTFDCSSFNEADCGSNSSNGCNKNYFPCGDYNNNQTGCEEQAANGCTFDTESGNCTGGNFTSCNGGNFICSGNDVCTSKTNESECVNTYYFVDCTGNIAYYICEGNYNTGECGGGPQGACQGNATCGNVVQSRCNNTYNPGCNWTNTLTTLLPNSLSFYTNYGGLDTAMTRVYDGVVYGGGTVTLTTQGTDKFENGATTKTLANGKKYRKWFFAIKGNCSDFNSSESQCTSTPGCSATYDYPEGSDPVFMSCGGEYLKNRIWFVGEST